MPLSIQLTEEKQTNIRYKAPIYRGIACPVWLLRFHP